MNILYQVFEVLPRKDENWENYISPWGDAEFKTEQEAIEWVDKQDGLMVLGTPYRFLIMKVYQTQSKREIEYWSQFEKPSQI